MVPSHCWNLGAIKFAAVQSGRQFLQKFAINKQNQYKEQDAENQPHSPWHWTASPFISVAKPIPVWVKCLLSIVIETIAPYATQWRMRTLGFTRKINTAKMKTVCRKFVGTASIKPKMNLRLRWHKTTNMKKYLYLCASSFSWWRIHHTFTAWSFPEAYSLIFSALF